MNKLSRVGAFRGLLPLFFDRKRYLELAVAHCLAISADVHGPGTRLDEAQQAEVEMYQDYSRNVLPANMAMPLAWAVLILAIGLVADSTPHQLIQSAEAQAGNGETEVRAEAGRSQVMTG